MPADLHEDMNEDELRGALVSYEEQFKRDHQRLDYTKSNLFQNVALYTPALSSGYIGAVEKLAQAQFDANLSGDRSKDLFSIMNSNFGFDAEDLKFINPNSKLCFYPWVLYSGGQGAKTLGIAQKNNWITQKPRDHRVMLIGDSGGFQIQQQTISYDPKTTPEQMLRWLERVADQSMILDFPTGGIDTGAMVPHIEKLKQEGINVEQRAKHTGFSTGYMACLIRTQQNNRYFTKHRATGKTKLLNVIQGRNEEESAYWFNTIKHFPFEGWSFAGKHSVHLSMTLRRLIQMRNEGLLKPDQLFHFLGVSTMKVGVALTFIQRAMREYTDAKDAQFTFDSASPTDSVANGYYAISGYDFGRDKWTVRTDQTNLEEHLNSQTPLRELSQKWKGKSIDRAHSQSTLGHILTLGDLVGAVDPKTGTRKPNRLQQALLTHHNTQALIEAFRHAYRYLDEKYTADRAPSIQSLDRLINEVFTSSNPMEFIDEAEIELNALAFEGKFGK